MFVVFVVFVATVTGGSGQQARNGDHRRFRRNPAHRYALRDTTDPLHTFDDSHDTSLDHDPFGDLHDPMHPLGFYNPASPHYLFDDLHDACSDDDMFGSRDDQ